MLGPPGKALAGATLMASDDGALPLVQIIVKCVVGGWSLPLQNHYVTVVTWYWLRASANHRMKGMSSIAQ